MNQSHVIDSWVAELARGARVTERNGRDAKARPSNGTERQVRRLLAERRREHRATPRVQPCLTG